MAATDWPVDLRGVTESVVTTLGPNDRWNAAALGIHAPESEGSADEAAATARTWGETRTRRNFGRRAAGYVQFTRDPVAFARAALTIDEREEPVLPSADAWARVSVESIETGESAGTTWVDWRLEPTDASVERRVVPTTNRGHAAVIEATVAASRLDAAGYDRDRLSDRLAYFADVVETCGGPAEQRALDVIRDVADW